MATQVTLPRLSPGMNEASVARWLKKPGDHVRQGEALFEVETEKVQTEVASPGEGVLSILIPEGKTVPIGTPLAVLAAPGEKVEEAGAAPPAAEPAPAAAPAAEPAPAAAPAAQPASQPAAPAAPPPPAAAPQPPAPGPRPPTPDPEHRLVASPAARRLARELGVDLSLIGRGSGPGGRLIERDVQRASEAGVAAPAPAAVQPAAAPAPAAAGARTIPLQGIRRTIAERMLQSQNSNATVTLTLEVDMQEATSLRQQLVGEWEKTQGVRISFTDVIVKAVAKALTEHPRLNASLQGDQIVEHAEVHVGVAVALENGLIVPVLRNADRKSLLDLGRETKDLAERARAGRLGAQDITGGTFTVTNLGTTGVDAFTPIINPPECAILGVGKIAPRPVVRDGEVVVRPTMWLSLTFDHRVVDGHPAGLFLRRVQEILEKPYLIFV